MKRAAGLWIDHRKAVIVFISDDGEESKEIESDMEKHTRFSGGSRSEQGGGEDQQDRQYSGHLNTYYDEVIAQLRDAESILIFGPGEAKGELEKRLANKGFAGRIVNNRYEPTSYGLLVHPCSRDAPAPWNGEGRIEQRGSQPTACSLWL
jgi:hypothetical protein